MIRDWQRTCVRKFPELAHILLVLLRSSFTQQCFEKWPQQDDCCGVLLTAAPAERFPFN